MQLRIVIPSHKRHDRVFAKKLVNDPIICVAESQADLYRQFNPDCEIVTHPDDVVGLIPKRNWMAKHFGNLFMLDDDVHACKSICVEKGEPSRIKDKNEITRIISILPRLLRCWMCICSDLLHEYLRSCTMKLHFYRCQR